MKAYVLTLKHDAGMVDLTVYAESLEAAIEQTMRTELCPRRSISVLGATP